MSNTENSKKTLNFNVLTFLDILKKDKRKLYIYCGVAAVLGGVIAFTTPKTYESTVILAPEESGAGFSGSLSSLASMVGMNMKIGQTGDALYPEIYPDLVGSTDFSVGLFPIIVKTKDGSVKCDYYTYLTKYNKNALVDYPKIGLGKLMKMLKPEEKIPTRSGDSKNSGPLWLTTVQEKIVNSIHANVVCQVDKKTSVITISVKDQDPLVAALMADSVKSH